MSRKVVLAAGCLVLLAAFLAFAWSVLGVHVTVVSEMRRGMIAEGIYPYTGRFIWYLVGPDIPAVSLPFWLATISTAVTLLVFASTRK